MADDDSSDNPFKPSLAVLLNKLDPKDGAQIMEYLKTHFLMMREKALLQASVRDQKKLLVENAKLKKDIEELKVQLAEKEKRKAAKLLAASLALPSDSPASSGLSVTPGPSPKEPATQSAASLSASQPVTPHDRPGRRRRGERRARPVSDPGLPAGLSSWRSRVDASRLDIRVGRVLSVKRHRAADDLMVQEVDVGESTARMVVSTLEDKMELEKGALVLLLCNIKPCPLKGVVSQARLLCCSAPDGQDMELLVPPPGAVPGDRVTFHNYPGDPDKVLLAKDRIWETLQSDLKTDSKGVACYKGVGFEVRGKGLCRAPTLINAPIR